MKCPDCNKEGVKFIHKLKIDRQGKSPRPRFRTIDKKAKCNKCKWEGEL